MGELKKQEAMMSLSQKTIDIVKSTAPVLRSQGETLTIKMYEILFAKYPETEALFSKALTN